MNPLTLMRLLEEPGFRLGLTVGAVGLVVLLLLRKTGWLLVWGIGAFAALAWAGRLTLAPNTPDWALPVTAAVAAAGSWGLRELLRSAPGWSIGVVFALWVLGVWGTVPDTERAMVALGVVAAMLPALWPRLGVRVGWEGAPFAIAALGFVTVTDGAARSQAMIGAFGMAGMVVAASAMLRFGSVRALSPWWLIGAQAAHVIASGRVAGQLTDPVLSIGVVVLSALMTGLVSWRVGRAKNS